ATVPELVQRRVLRRHRPRLDVVRRRRERPELDVPQPRRPRSMRGPGRDSPRNVAPNPLIDRAGATTKAEAPHLPEVRGRHFQVGQATSHPTVSKDDPVITDGSG